jgi:hypothetical protein
MTESFRILRSVEEVGVGSRREYEVDMGHLEDMKIRIWSYNDTMITPRLVKVLVRNSRSFGEPCGPWI